jgi:hypothetical protein
MAIFLQDGEDLSSKQGGGKERHFSYYAYAGLTGQRRWSHKSEVRLSVQNFQLWSWCMQNKFSRIVHYCHMCVHLSWLEIFLEIGVCISFRSYIWTFLGCFRLMGFLCIGFPSGPIHIAYDTPTQLQARCSISQLSAHRRGLWFPPVLAFSNILL